VLILLVCAIIEGGFHSGPFVSVSGSDTAHVRLFPHSTLLLVRAFAHLGFDLQDHHDDHILSNSFFFHPSQTHMDTLTPFKRPKPRISKPRRLFAGRLAITRRSRSGSERRDRASSYHDVLRTPRPRGPTRRLCPVESRRAQVYGWRVPRRRRRVRTLFFHPFLHHHYYYYSGDEHSVDGGARFETMPGAGDADLRMTYCAFVVCALLGDWSCIDLPRALSYIQRCRVRVSLLPPLLPYV
jgi:hypothetical protein